ncbi:MAG: hypothetical protein WAK82_38500 [Streptosporangiaceae bacterium]
MRGRRGDGELIAGSQRVLLTPGLHGDLPVQHLEAFLLAAVQVQGRPDHAGRDADLEQQRPGPARADREAFPGNRILQLVRGHGRPLH